MEALRLGTANLAEDSSVMGDTKELEKYWTRGRCGNSLRIREGARLQLYSVYTIQIMSSVSLSRNLCEPLMLS